MHKSKPDEDDVTTVSLTDADADADGSWGGGGVGVGDCATGLEGVHVPGLLGQGGDPSKGSKRRVKSAGKLMR